MLYVAVVPLIAEVPSVVTPSLNVTVPVAPLVTVAVSVMLPPYVDGFAEEAREVVEGEENDQFVLFPLSSELLQLG